MKKVINQYYRKVYRHTNGFILTLKNFDVLYYFNFINNTKSKYEILLVRRENAELNNIKQWLHYYKCIITRWWNVGIITMIMVFTSRDAYETMNYESA